MKTFNYIYLITNNLNGKIYVGKHSTDNLDDGYMGSGVALHHAYNKYGQENFTKKILAYADTEEKLNWFERFYIKKYHARTKGYNLTDGGDGTLGLCMSEEHKKKISEALKGKIFSEERKRKISEANKGQIPWSKGKKCGPRSEETRKKMSEARKGNTPWNKGKPMSEEQKRKMSETLKGRTSPNKGKQHSEESRKKISESLKGNTPWNKGKPMSEEQKRKISESIKRKKEAV